MHSCNNIIYRSAINDDLNALINTDYKIFNEKINEQYYKSHIDDNTCFVAEQNGKIIGCIIFYKYFYISDWEEGAYIKSLFSTLRNCKVGEKLMKIAMDKLSDFFPIFLHVNVTNYKAINLYFKLGFKIYDVIDKYYQSKNQDAFLMIYEE